MTTDRDTLSELLRPVVDTMRADGFDLELSVRDGIALLRVVAGADTCADCLMPKNHLRSILDRVLSDHPVPYDLLYPGDFQPPSHDSPTQPEVAMTQNQQGEIDTDQRRPGFDRLRELQPEAMHILDTARELAATSTDSDLLSLCRDYVDSILGGRPWSPPPLTAREQAFVSFTEQFMISVDSMSDRQISTLLQYATADEVYAFINAIFTTEMSRRVELVSEVVLP